MQKILMICNTDGALYNFRLPLIKLLKKDNYRITTISSPGKYQEKLSKEVDNAYFVSFDNSLNPLKNILLVYNLFKLIRKEKPTIIQTFTHKANILGTIAAKMSGHKKIFCTITGLGIIFTHNSIKHKFLQRILKLLYKIISILSTAFFFQNKDDMEEMQNRGIVKKRKAILTNGSAIDLHEYKQPTLNEVSESRKFLSRQINSSIDNKYVIIFPARAIPEKGVEYFYSAAKAINSLTDKYLFLHLGGPYENSKYSDDFLEKYAKQCGVFYLGYRTDINIFMTASDIILLPSYYREGVPHSLIEGMALNNVIITTDLPGCRETIKDNWNGFLIKPKDVKSIVNVILNIDAKKIESYKRNSRKLCVEKFGIQILYNTTIKAYNNKQTC